MLEQCQQRNKARVDLILGAWAGRQAGPPRVFIDSARRAVPNAKIVVFCHDISDEASNFFRDSGVITRPFQHWRWWNGPVHTYRFVLFARYAAKHAPEFDHIMTADLRDVVVQSDPFAHLDSRNVHFFEEHSNQTLSSNRHYRRWMRRFVDEEDRRACANEIPVCCGIVLGGADEMARYLDALAKRLSRMGWLRRRKFGADSALHNLICYVSRDVDGVVMADGDLVATMADTGDTYAVDDAGIIRRSDGHAPPICHQYDRFPQIAEAVRSRFCNPGAAT